MTDIAIRVENLSKRYRIGRKEELPDTMVGAMTAWLKSPVTNFRQLRRLSHFSRNGHDPSTGLGTGLDDIIWALQDVSFEVKQGEVVGIIGRNGAGKSTLLKILSRITEPTGGRAIIDGRVSSLLEVGTGFHPELTGRENIYLNGTVLGITKAEISRKFDEIVDFSGVEKFIDTPVKRYSSGMQVRLAFSVAAHLEPEILLVDEVLAVGDAEFQKKCLGKMENVANEGRTVLFVSHNMQAIQRLCNIVYLFERGTLIEKGLPGPVVSAYLAPASAMGCMKTNKITISNSVSIEQISVLQNGYKVTEILDNSQSFEISVLYDVIDPVDNLLLGFDVRAADGTLLFRSYDMRSFGMGVREPGPYRSTQVLPGGLFQPGFYYFECVVGIHRVKWLSRNEISIRLHFDGPRSTDVDLPGVILPVGKWIVETETEKL